MYRDLIAKAMAALGRTGAHPLHHVEAWMRVEHSTLDHLSPVAFRREVAIAIECCDESNVVESEGLARSFGLAR